MNRGFVRKIALITWRLDSLLGIRISPVIGVDAVSQIAREMAEQVFQCDIVLVGRQKLSLRFETSARIEFPFMTTALAD